MQAVIAFRWFNRINVGEQLVDLLLTGWDTQQARRRLAAIHPIVTGAYVIKTPDGKTKLDGVLWCIEQAHSRFPVLPITWGNSLREVWLDLQILPFMGGFMAYEVVSDLRWTPILARAGDISTWAAIGPGCARGLGYLVADDSERYRRDSAKDQVEMLTVMRELLLRSQDPACWPYIDVPWEMRECEHWACEFAKYRQAQAGYRLKRRFRT